MPEASFIYSVLAARVQYGRQASCVAPIHLPCWCRAKQLPHCSNAEIDLILCRKQPGIGEYWLCDMALLVLSQAARFLSSFLSYGTALCQV